MQPSTRKTMIQAMKAQVDVCRLQCQNLSADFETARTFEERSRLARRWDQFLKTGYAAQLMLALLERQERESLAPRERGALPR
jgi:hypothetical protein